MAAGFWTKLYYKVSEHSKYYFIVLLVANVGLMVASLIVFLIFGSYTIEDDKGNVVKTGTEEMSRGFYYMIITLFIMAASQFYVGIHSVVLQNAFDLFGYCTLGTLTNIQMAVFFWVACNPLFRGIRYYAQDQVHESQAQMMNFHLTPALGFPLIMSFLSITAVTILMMWPIFDKFSWDQYQLIGLDEELQLAFKNFQLTRSAFLIFFCTSLMQFFTLIYFEQNTTFIIIFSLMAAYLLIEIRLGYLGFKAESALRVKVFCLIAVMYSVGFWTVFLLRWQKVMPHYRSGSFNKFINFTISATYMVNLVLLIKYALKSVEGFGTSITSVRNLMNEKERKEGLLEDEEVDHHVVNKGGIQADVIF